MPGLLEGKIALITGTGGGQGRAAALAFSAEGATIVGCDLKVDGQKETDALVEEAGGTIFSEAPLDLTDPDVARRWVDAAAEQHGGIDIMYNNAAGTRFAFIDEMTVEDWRFTLTNEVDIVFFGTRAAWPHLIARGGGVVINIASVAGMHASRDLGGIAHAAGKAAVIGFTRQAAAEGAKHGIRVVCISPGPIVTPVTEAHMASDPLVAPVAARTLLGRWGRAEEIANTALFLASDKASYITGVNYPVDGGMSAG
jgi:NAD(P)-dependent dehydrogenase (short-subunit alcohol dehydrogenase family)